jgi:hypothetical protein
MRLELLTIKCPDSNGFLDVIEQKLLDKGFTLTEDARNLLKNTVTEISSGKQFIGFKSIIKLANEIIFDLLTMDLNGNKIITAEMLSKYDENSKYVEQAKRNINFERKIGFGERSI